MEAEHTPGPWKIKARHTDKGVRNTVYAKKEKRNANILNGDKNGVLYLINVDEALANARLIAAAPELLEACIKTVEENLHLADGENCTLIHLVKAIAKATGA